MNASSTNFFHRCRATLIGKKDRREGDAGLMRRGTIEPLEGRIAPSYTFALSGTTATVSPVAATGGPILIKEVLNAGNPVLEHSQDGGASFSLDWNDSVAGVQTLPATTSAVINLTPTTGSGTSITLGDLTSAASNIFALFNLGVVGTPANVSVIIDDRASTHAAGNYEFYTTLGVISGPGGTTGGINFTSFGPVGSYLIEGGPAANTFNIHSTFSATTTSTTLIGGAGADVVNVLGDSSPGIGTPLTIDMRGGANIVNVGNSGTLANVSSTVIVTDTGGTTALTLDNHADTAHGTATLDNLSGNVNAPFEVKGLSSGAVFYGSGVAALNINGGANGAAGVTFNVNNTQAGTTTTITGGPNQNFINLSNAGETSGLDNLPGPVAVTGGASSADVVTLDDSGADFNDGYTITNTTVIRAVFGGLTYGNIGALTLNAENTLGTNGNNTINITSTAGSVTTNINGQGGADTINVHATGSSGALNISTGSGGSVVNVFAESEPTQITDNGEDTVNIGSAGGAGTLDNILNPITINNIPSFNQVNIHDENSNIGKTWTIKADNGGNTESVGATGVGLISLRPGDLNGLTIDGGSGVNTFIVKGSAADIHTIIQGNGSDTFDITGSGLGKSSTNDFLGDGPTAIFNLSPVNPLATAVNISGSAPPAFPGDQLNYSGAGAIQVGAVGAGKITQAGFLAVNFVNMDVVATAQFSSVPTTLGYVVTVAGDQDYQNEPDHFVIAADASGQFLEITDNGSMGFYGDQSAALQINVNGMGGNDDLTVDSTGALVHIPNGINYDGGTGFNTLHFTQTGGAKQTSDTYSVGPKLGDAQSVIVGPSGAQTVFAQNLTGVTDSVPTSSLLVNGTPADNAITSTKGASAGSGSVAIDNFPAIQYSHKDHFSINGLGGSDEINGFGAPGGDSDAFSAPHTYDLTTSTTAGKPTPGLGPVAVVTGDLTGSGFDDIITVNEKSGNISVLINNGDGTFEQPVVFKSGGLAPRDLVLGNFDNKPGLDLAVTNSGSADVAIFSGNGAGGFGAPTLIKTAADPTAIAAGFINGDNHEDLVVANASLGAITVLLGNGTGGFTPSTSVKAPIKIGGKDPVDLAIADFNGDGKADVVTANFGSGNVSFLEGNGDGSFAAPTHFATGPHPTALAIADINNDGNLDVAVSDGVKNVVSILYGGGNVAAAIQFQPRLQVAVAGSRGSDSIVLGDFNGDGQIDIGLGNVAGGAFTVLLGAGPKTFSQPYQFALGSNPTAGETGSVVDDLNHDGMLDIVVATQKSNDVSVFLHTP